MSKAVLTAPLERSTCPYQRSLLSFSMRSRSSIPSRASSSVDLMVAVSCGLTLQICLIIALSFRCRRWRQGFVTGQVSLAWSIALRTYVLYLWPRVLKERWREERTGFSSLNFFQAVFTRVVVESSQPPAAEAILKILSVCCAPTDPPKSPRPKIFFRYFRFFIFFGGGGGGVSAHSDRSPKTDIKGVVGLPK